MRTQRHNLLTQAQRRYVLHYCNLLDEALSDEKDGDHVIDMNAVADAVGKDGEKPPFYYVEERQQHQFTCTECEGFNDIIGRFAYCSQCGTRNDLHELQEKIIPTIRAVINSGRHDGTCLRDVASAFDSFVFQYVKQLLQRVPMIPARRNRLENMRFHQLGAVVSELSGTFGIDLQEGLKAAEVNQAHAMFCRRHVYEHNGGEVDEKYLRESGDMTVRLKQSLRENAGSLHQFANSVARMATNLHNGFHLIYPPEKQAIKALQEKKARIAAHNKGHAP